VIRLPHGGPFDIVATYTPAFDELCGLLSELGYVVDDTATGLMSRPRDRGKDGIHVSHNIGSSPRRKRGVRPNQWRYQMAELPPTSEGILLGYFIVSDDVERSRRFYTEVLGGRVLFSGTPTVVALSNSWIVINAGGGPTDDKPTVTLETPRDLERVSSFLNFRVKDIEAVYAEWSARGAQLLTPPKRHQYETRCYIRDPDGYLIEVGQTTDPEGDWSPAHWPSGTPAEKT
jgi:catechol 2,3-dioxygenase-like lactoylglutathione lyase family enzyme